MKVGSLFAGIGGFDLAARWVGWETAWFSEVHPYACKVLEKNFPGVPNHGDITQIDFTRVEPVEVLCGGFPCQDISSAGTKTGIGGARSGLWSHYARAIGELRPRYVIVENVAALLGRGLDRVLGDLAALGYDAEWHCIPAAYIGAPHLRDRVWIVAYAPGFGHWDGRRFRDVLAAYGRPIRFVRPESCGSSEQPEDLADPFGFGQPRQGQPLHARDSTPVESREADDAFDGRLSRQWAVEPHVGRVANGVPARVDRLTGLGNAIVPQVAEVIFRAIQAHEEG